jgi:hypothetical protein
LFSIDESLFVRKSSLIWSRLLAFKYT